jgi:hypothetical protein
MRVGKAADAPTEKRTGKARATAWTRPSSGWACPRRIYRPVGSRSSRSSSRIWSRRHACRRLSRSVPETNRRDESRQRTGVFTRSGGVWTRWAAPALQASCGARRGGHRSMGPSVAVLWSTLRQILGVGCPMWPWCYSGDRTTPITGRHSCNVQSQAANGMCRNPRG